MTTLLRLSRAGVAQAAKKNPRLVALGGGEVIAHAAIMHRRLSKTPQPLRDKLLCIENRDRSLECGLSIVGHLFKRAVLVSEVVQAILSCQKGFRSE